MLYTTIHVEITDHFFSKSFSHMELTLKIFFRKKLKYVNKCKYKDGYKRPTCRTFQLSSECKWITALSIGRSRLISIIIIAL